MFRRHNRDMEDRIAQFRESVVERWDRLNGREMRTLSNTLDELQQMLEHRYARRRKRLHVNMKPLMAAYGAQRKALGKRAGHMTAQAGHTFKTKPMVAALVGATLGLFVMATMGRRYLGQGHYPA